MFVVTFQCERLIEDLNAASVSQIELLSLLRLWRSALPGPRGAFREVKTGEAAMRDEKQKQKQKPSFKGTCFFVLVGPLNVTLISNAFVGDDNATTGAAAPIP